MDIGTNLFKSIACIFRGLMAASSEVELVLSDRALLRSRQSAKLCVVDGKLSLIHHHGLAQQDPQAFTRFQYFSKHNRLTLIADRRYQHTHTSIERRRREWFSSLSIVFSFTVFLTHANANENLPDSVHAELSHDATSGLENMGQASAVQQLSLIAPLIDNDEYVLEQAKPSQSLSAHHSDRSANTAPNVQQELNDISAIESIDRDANALRYSKALRLLNKKWRNQKHDPDYLASDLEEIAEYISTRPNAFDLLMSLRSQPWSLRYKAGDFRTEVRGSPLRVNSANIFFDTRSAAVLANRDICESDPGYCIARPVDALLHELIHAKIALLESQEFIRDGGMSSLIYPYAHERKVISMERELYSSMTETDQLSRPQRHRHNGAIAQASCVSCVGT